MHRTLKENFQQLITRDIKTWNFNNKKKTIHKDIETVCDIKKTESKTKVKVLYNDRKEYVKCNSQKEKKINSTKLCNYAKKNFW